MRKIAIVVNSLGYGGNERSAVNVANALQNSVDVTIIIQEDCGNHYNYHGKTICMQTPCANSLPGKVINSIRRIVQLRRIVKHEKFDTLFIILPITNPINYISFRGRKLVSCRDCGDLMRHIRQYVFMTKKSDGIICNSEYQRRLLCDASPFLSDKIHTIYNIVDFAKIQCLCEEVPEERFVAFTRNCRTVIASGRFVDAKGFNHLIKAFKLVIAKNPDARLVIMGDGERHQDIINLIDKLGLSKVVLLMGFQPNPFVYIRHADIFVLSSVYEGFPNVLVKAMACDTAVIATDCPSGPSEILNGHAQDCMVIAPYGILVPSFQTTSEDWNANKLLNNHRIMAEAINYLLEHDKEKIRMVKAANNRVKDFGFESIKSKWELVLCKKV